MDLYTVEDFDPAITMLYNVMFEKDKEFKKMDKKDWHSNSRML